MGHKKVRNDYGPSACIWLIPGQCSDELFLIYLLGKSRWHGGRTAFEAKKSMVRLKPAGLRRP